MNEKLIFLLKFSNFAVFLVNIRRTGTKYWYCQYLGGTSTDLVLYWIFFSVLVLVRGGQGWRDSGEIWSDLSGKIRFYPVKTRFFGPLRGGCPIVKNFSIEGSGPFGGDILPPSPPVPTSGLLLCFTVLMNQHGYKEIRLKGWFWYCGGIPYIRV